MQGGGHLYEFQALLQVAEKEEERKIEMRETDTVITQREKIKREKHSEKTRAKYIEREIERKREI